MNSDEAAISRLTAAIKAAEPHIAVLHDRIINHGDRTAHAWLHALLAAAEEMTDNIAREDFMCIDLYVRIAEFHGDQRDGCLEEVSQ